MRMTEQLDQMGVNEMSFDEFERHALLCCVRPLDEGAGMRIESIDAPGYADLGQLRSEITRSFVLQDLPREDVGRLTDRLVRELVAEPFHGEAWYVRLDRAKTIVLVKADAALAFTPRDVLRGVYSDAYAEACGERNRQSMAQGDPRTALNGLST